jgi:predicted phosphohydrolase
MPEPLRIAVTADLHWGVRPAGDEATRLLASFLRDADERPDVLILGGDIGAGHDFGPCLELFADLPCRKALIPGNHDIWVEKDDVRGDSWHVYDHVLPEVSARHGFVYLDHGPLILKEAELAIAGSINWYDYSWSIDKLPAVLPDWRERLGRKQFSQGRHNDGRFVRWSHSDQSFTEHVVAKLAGHLEECWRQAPAALVMTHHPAFYGLSFPREKPPDADGLLWDAFSGNGTLESLLATNSPRIPLIFSGHTHRERTNTLAQSRGFNIGGDYHFKRLLLIDWPSGCVVAHTFGDPGPVTPNAFAKRR